MMITWVLPTEAEQERGIVAWLEDEKSFVYTERIPYFERHLQNRLKRDSSESFPQWWEGAQVDSSAAWLEYIETGEVGAEIETVLLNLNSYQQVSRERNIA